MLKVLCWGMGGSVNLVEPLRAMIKELGMELVTMSEWPQHDIKWDKDTFIDEIKKADIIILPVNPIQTAKSANRLVQSLVCGKPCICGPLPAYIRIKEQYPEENIHIANNLEEWKCQLQKISQSMK